MKETIRKPETPQISKALEQAYKEFLKEMRRIKRYAETTKRMAKSDPFYWGTDIL